MISIVIPNYNGKAYLKRCIESVLEQDGTHYEIELIIVDNASEDDDYAWVKINYPTVRWHKLDKNYGFSRAVNEGIRLALGEYVILLNNDTVLYPGFVQALYGEIVKDKQIFAICSQMIQYQNTELIDDAGDNYNLLGWAYKRGDGKFIGTYDKQEQVFSACAGAAIYRKAIFDEIGYFDEAFFAYMEDVDISYRARIYGYKNVYCPEAKVLHIGSATSGSKYNTFKVRLAARNNVYVPYKNMPFIQLLVNSPFLIAGYLIKYLFFVKKGFGAAYRQGFLEGIRTLQYIEKVPFKWEQLGNCIQIEGMLIYDTVRYIIQRLLK